MTLSPDLLRDLRCPADTAQTLREASADEVERLNAAIGAGGISNVGGEDVSDSIQGGLIRQDGMLLYPIRDETPCLLCDEAIPLGDAK